MLKNNLWATTLIPLWLLLSPQPVFPHQKDSLLQQLREAHKPDQQFRLLQQLYLLSCHNNYQEAEKYLVAAVDIGIRTGNAHYLMTGYQQLAALSEWRYDLVQAYLFYLEAQKAAVEADDLRELAQINYKIGTILYKQERYAEAITYLQHAASLAAAQQQQQLAPKVMVYLGMCYQRADHEKTATQLLDSLEQAAIKTNNHSFLAFLYARLQGLYTQLHQPTQALAMNEKAMQFLSADSNRNDMIRRLQERAGIYQSIDSTDKAMLTYKRALNELNHAKTLYNLKVSILDSLAVCYQRTNDPIRAQSYIRQSQQLKDSLTAGSLLVTMPLQSAANYGILPIKSKTVSRFNNWTSRVVPLLLVGMTILSIIIYRKYRKMRNSIQEEKNDALTKARQLAEQEKQMAIQLAYQLIEEEKKIAVHEAREIIEQAKAEARRLQAEVATTSVLLANKTDYLTQLQLKLNTTDNSDCKRFAKEIKHNLGDGDYWGDFIKNFNLLHSNTIDRITKKHPDLTPNEVKLVCFILSGLNNKEIAGIFSVEPESVKKARYRLKKKLRLPEEESLKSYLDGLQSV